MNLAEIPTVYMRNIAYAVTFAAIIVLIIASRKK